MRSRTQFGKTILPMSSVTAALLIGGMMQSTAAAEPEPFAGAATLCAISQEVLDPPEQKGKSGVLVKYDMRFYYLIASDDPDSLMNGWEDQTNNWKQTKSGTDFYWGHTYFIPDAHVGLGALEEDFKFKGEEILNGFTGTFKGTGDLEGVTVGYALSAPYQVNVASFPVRCGEYTSLCDNCYPALSPGDDGIPGTDDDQFTQYDMSGWIEGY